MTIQSVEWIRSKFFDFPTNLKHSKINSIRYLCSEIFGKRFFFYVNWNLENWEHPREISMSMSCSESKWVSVEKRFFFKFKQNIRDWVSMHWVNTFEYSTHTKNHRKFRRLEINLYLILTWNILKHCNRYQHVQHYDSTIFKFHQ